MSSLFQKIIDTPEFWAMMICLFLISVIYPSNESSKESCKVYFNDVIINVIITTALLFMAGFIFTSRALFIKHPESASFILGLLMTLSLGTLTKPIMEITTKDTELELKNKWSKWEGLWKNPDGGFWMGLLERVLYFMVLLLGEPLFIVGILTFKVAAKWEAWKNIVQVPQNKPDGFPDDESFLIFRREWGAYQLNRYLAGTLSNILFAIIGYGFYMKVLDP